MMTLSSLQNRIIGSKEPPEGVIEIGTLVHSKMSRESRISVDFSLNAFID